MEKENLLWRPLTGETERRRYINPFLSFKNWDYVLGLGGDTTVCNSVNRKNCHILFKIPLLSLR